MNIQYLESLPEDWQEVARVFSALGDGTRQTILLLFEPREEISLKTLVDVLPLSRTAVAHHVATLEQAGILRALKRGREVYYSLNTGPIMSALTRTQEYALQLDEADDVPAQATQTATPAITPAHKQATQTATPAQSAAPITPLSKGKES